MIKCKKYDFDLIWLKSNKKVFVVIFVFNPMHIVHASQTFAVQSVFGWGCLPSFYRSIDLKYIIYLFLHFSILNPDTEHRYNILVYFIGARFYWGLGGGHCRLTLPYIFYSCTPALVLVLRFSWLWYDGEFWYDLLQKNNRFGLKVFFGDRQ